MVHGLGASLLCCQYLIGHLFLIFVLLSRQVLAVPFCTALYGSPDRQYCDHLLYGQPQNASHGFV